MSLRPHWIRRRVSDIDFAALGRPYVLIDLDNTLAVHGTWTPEPDAVMALDEARQAGVVRGICVVSNYVIGKRRLERVQHVARLLGARAEGAPIWAAKPSPRPYRLALAQLQATPEQTVMIGDQVFTDILGARRLGMATVLVHPLGPDTWTTAFTLRRWREKRLLPRWEAEGDLPL